MCGLFLGTGIFSIAHALILRADIAGSGPPPQLGVSQTARGAINNAVNHPLVIVRQKGRIRATLAGQIQIRSG